MMAAEKRAEEEEEGYNPTLPRVVDERERAQRKRSRTHLGGKLFTEKVSSKNVGFASLIPRKNIGEG